MDRKNIPQEKYMTLLQWPIYGRVGVSSKTLWCSFMNATDKSKHYHFDTPYDWSDFSRCYKLVKRCRVPDEMLNRVPDDFRFWKPFIDNWDKLCSMYENEEPMHEFICELNKKSKDLRNKK